MPQPMGSAAPDFDALAEYFRGFVGHRLGREINFGYGRLPLGPDAVEPALAAELSGRPWTWTFLLCYARLRGVMSNRRRTHCGQSPSAAISGVPGGSC